MKKLNFDEIVVTAEVVKSGEAGLLAPEKINSVQDGISFEEISRGSDGNVGAAMKKVAGVSVVGGKDIYVRDLETVTVTYNLMAQQSIHKPK